ncbi:retrovirus-related pol polyprotein from transposon TNT 1-94 [Tanacetum coccineum]
MTNKSQQSALDNALVAPENQHVIGKCNMRINPAMKPKEPTYQVVLDALALTTCYLALLIIAEVPVIYMHHHSGEIKYIIDVIVDHLHQPWRTFASIINKCLCEKVSGLDKIRLSRVQILWGMYYKKNLDFVSLIWEDLAYQIDNKDSKKQDNMFYPRFTRIIIHHFLKKDKSISMRNRTFMHTARDDILLGTMRFVSRHEDTQVYAISSEETPSKKKSTKAKKDVPSTKKPATKPKQTKKKAPVKADRGKRVPDEQQRKISGIDKGTSAKPRVFDVPKYDSENDEGNDDGDDSDGNDDDDDNDGDDDDDDNDGDNDDDNDGNDDDDSDHKRTESDRDENPNLNQFNE